MFLAGAGLLLLSSVPALAGWLSGDRALAPLRDGCEPLRIVDRAGRPLRVLPAACGARARGPWAALPELPRLLRDAVVLAEDKRFFAHAGQTRTSLSRQSKIRSRRRGLMPSASVGSR